MNGLVSLTCDHLDLILSNLVSNFGRALLYLPKTSLVLPLPQAVFYRFIYSKILFDKKWEHFCKKGSSTYSCTRNGNVTVALKCMANYKFSALQLHEKTLYLEKICARFLSCE